jgi:hypothetical protein
MVGVEQCLFDELMDVSILSCVEHSVSVPAYPHQPSGSELGQLLGYGWGIDPHVRGQLAHGVLAVQERPQDLEAGPVAEQLEGLDRQGELFGIWLRHLALD